MIFVCHFRFCLVCLAPWTIDANRERVLLFWVTTLTSCHDWPPKKRKQRQFCNTATNLSNLILRKGKEKKQQNPHFSYNSGTWDTRVTVAWRFCIPDICGYNIRVLMFSFYHFSIFLSMQRILNIHWNSLLILFIAFSQTLYHSLSHSVARARSCVLCTTAA